MDRPGHLDISIGEKEFIKWIKFDSRVNPVEIDSIILVNAEIWSTLELHCVAGCCGLDAFDFSPSAVQRELALQPHAALVDDLEGMLDRVRRIETPVLKSLRLNTFFNKAVFVALLEHILKTVRQSPW